MLQAEAFSKVFVLQCTTGTLLDDDSCATKYIRDTFKLWKSQHHHTIQINQPT